MPASGASPAQSLDQPRVTHPAFTKTEPCREEKMDQWFQLPLSPQPSHSPFPRDGPDQTSPQLGVFSGNTALETAHSSTNQVLLKFHSDFSNGGFFVLNFHGTCTPCPDQGGVPAGLPHSVAALRFHLDFDHIYRVWWDFLAFDAGAPATFCLMLPSRLPICPVASLDSL